MYFVKFSKFYGIELNFQKSPYLVILIFIISWLQIIYLYLFTHFIKTFTFTFIRIKADILCMIRLLNKLLNAVYVPPNLPVIFHKYSPLL